MLTDRYFNQKTDGVPELVIQEKNGRETQFIPLQSTVLTGDIIGPLLHAEMVHTFSFQDCRENRTVEAIYRFPLTGDAAVMGATVKFGSVVIETILKPRGEAEAEFGKALKNQRQAVLVTQEKADTFTLRIAGLRPGETIEVRTSFVQMADRQESGWQIRVPLTVAPKYVRPDESGTGAAQSNPLALSRDPGHRFSLHLTAYGLKSVTSPTHGLLVESEADCLNLVLQAGSVIPDRDFILNWKTAGEDSSDLMLQIFGHVDPETRELHAMALVTSPDATELSKREIILMVDRSGSMEGAKWEAADWAVQSCLCHLQPDEYFNVVLFNNDSYFFRGSSVPATAENIQEALKFISRKDSGGTELGVALERTLRTKKLGPQYASHVLIVTDAQVSDESRILRLADEENLVGNSRNISIVCIDSAPNGFLAKELARRGRGICEFLVSDPSQGDVASALEKIMENFARPGWRNTVLHIGSEQVWSDETVLDRTDGTTVYAGDLIPQRTRCIPVIIRAAGDAIPFVLEDGQGTKLASCIVNPGIFRSHAGMRVLVGVRRIRLLETLRLARDGEGEVLAAHLFSLGLDKEEAKIPVYKETSILEKAGRIDRLIETESLKYGVLSSLTGFVAVRRDVKAGSEVTYAVANAVPHGWELEDQLLTMRSHNKVSAVGVSLVSGCLKSVCFSQKSKYFSEELEEIVCMNAPLEMNSCIPFDFSGDRKDGPMLLTLFDGAQFSSACEAVSELQVASGTVLKEIRIESQKKPIQGQLQIFVDDLLVPAIVIQLSDLLNAGKRPLNMTCLTGWIRAVLRLEPGSAATSNMKISLGY